MYEVAFGGCERQAKVRSKQGWRTRLPARKYSAYGGRDRKAYANGGRGMQIRDDLVSKP